MTKLTKFGWFAFGVAAMLPVLWWDQSIATGLTESIIAGRKILDVADKREAARKVAEAALSEQVQCIAVERLDVAGKEWHVRIHNSCVHATTERLYVRVAFYDAGAYRHGFARFIVEPMSDGERVRLDAEVPRRGAVSARVLAITTDPGVALGWE